jgi:hypothetical protein
MMVGYSSDRPLLWAMNGYRWGKLALTSAETAAKLTLRDIEKNSARMVFGPDGHATAALSRLLGATYMALPAPPMRADRRWT